MNPGVQPEKANKTAKEQNKTRLPNGWKADEMERRIYKKKQYTAVTILKGHNSNSIQTFMGIVYIA